MAKLWFISYSLMQILVLMTSAMITLVEEQIPSTEMPGAKLVMMNTALPTMMVVTDGISLEHRSCYLLDISL
jgi:hypothetical protein